MATTWSTSPLPGPSSLPSWPLVALLAAFPLWWGLGVVDFVWVPIAVAMAGYLGQVCGVRVPRGFGLWLFFVCWMLGSSVMVDTAAHAVEFTYRASIYLASTVLFIYVYNSRRSLPDRRVCGLLTLYWTWTVLGGFLGMLLPTQTLKTPAFFVIRLISSDLAGVGFVDTMVVRRLAQYNPDSYLGVEARPSAPFLYANNWGSAYSLLLPFVIVYLVHVRRTKRFWALLLLVPLSLVPALLTLNRGMLIGLGIAAVYMAFRLAVRGRLLPVVGILVAGLLGAAVFNAIAASRLETRLEGSSTTTRASLYTQSLELVPGSPVFGYGVPVQTLDPDQPPIGTQGQVWMLLVSHGPVGAASFLGWFLLAWSRSRKRQDGVGATASAVLLVGVVETTFYGLVPYGLPILMIAAALGLRGATPGGPSDPASHPLHDVDHSRRRDQAESDGEGQPGSKLGRAAAE